MKVLLIANEDKDLNLAISKEVNEYLENNHCEIYCDSDFLMNNLGLQKIDDFILDTINFAIIIGGDGTVLKYASKYANYKFPYVGINLGRVGALTILEKDNYKEYLDKIIAGEYFTVEHLGLECKVNAKSKNEYYNFVGYNDIILHRGASLKLLPIKISINDSIDDLFYADGMVVSTPNGSSAYNVSASGPLLSTSSKCYVVTPICPQSKSFTPLVISENDNVKLVLSDKTDLKNNEVTISADGCHKYYVNVHDEIYISKSKSSLKMIEFDKNTSMYRSVYKAVTSIEKKGEI